MEMTPWRCFTVSNSLVFTEVISLHALSSMGEEGTALSPLAPHPTCANVALQ